MRMGILGLLAGCQSGAWSLVLEAVPVPAAAEPACTLTVDRLVAVVQERALLDEGGAATSQSQVAWGVDVLAGPGSPRLEVDRPRHAGLRVAFGPPGDVVDGELRPEVLEALADHDAGMRVAGTLDCGVPLRWSWDLPGPVTQTCTSSTLDVPRGPVTDIGWALAPHALFVEDMDAPLDLPPSVAAFADADADGDGDLTLLELADVDAAALGFRAGGESPPRDLAEWVARRSGRIGSFPEGWCRAGR